ncbi:hypothetical protein DU002_00290 [Corallincola holothuriorum]|uniref:Uncharacterized protein n=1 Tax=Corallincola holothuriorum TaxID=2282215 RepID=A0A368NRK0_9GAMM|nr:hypothetical protein DU002_00290 [Corallincola holothuriorum]
MIELRNHMVAATYQQTPINKYTLIAMANTVANSVICVCHLSCMRYLLGKKKRRTLFGAF